MPQLIQIFKFVVAMMVIICITYLVERRINTLEVYAHSRKNNSRNHTLGVKATKNQRMFKILYWSNITKKGHVANWLRLANQQFEQCQYKNCYITKDRAQYNSSDAVVIKINKELLPTYRFPWQIWIASCHESPLIGNYTRYNNNFNATWTYSTKSDIYSHTYMKRFVRTSKNNNYMPVAFKKKTKMAAWFVSHCCTPSKREELVTALQKYIDVDVYGHCGPFNCGAQKMDKDCDRMLSSSYKFYLSFENSLCDQYVTEKLWRAYGNNVIPVVMGASNYSAYLPVHSYIDVGDFQSVKELAEYMKLLSTNETLYLEYFQWKIEYVTQGFDYQGCPLCEYLNLNENVTKFYGIFDEYWDKNTDCFSPTVYYKNLFNSINNQNAL